MAGVLTHHESQVAVLGVESALTLECNLPHLDGATALYPLYAAIVQAVCPAPEPALDIWIMSEQGQYLVEATGYIPKN